MNKMIATGRSARSAAQWSGVEHPRGGVKKKCVRSCFNQTKKDFVKTKSFKYYYRTRYVTDNVKMTPKMRARWVAILILFSKWHMRAIYCAGKMTPNLRGIIMMARRKVHKPISLAFISVCGMGNRDTRGVSFYKLFVVRHFENVSRHLPSMAWGFNFCSVSASFVGRIVRNAHYLELTL